LNRTLMKRGIGLQGSGGVSKAALERFLIELRSENPEVVAVFLSATEELAQKNVVHVDQKHVKLAKRPQGMDAILPAGRKVMRLEMSDRQTESLVESLKERMKTPNFFGDLVHDVDIFRVPREMPGQDQGGRSTQGEDKGTSQSCSARLVPMAGAPPIHLFFTSYGF
jgi:hypothetical protein